MSLAFLGGGNMATAMIGGLVGKGADPASIAVAEALPAARAKLAAQWPLRITGDPAEALAGADTLVLAVKPQDMRAALVPLAGRMAGRLVISIAAGLGVATLARWLGGHARIVRAMPNTPALIGMGIAGLFAAPAVDAAGRARAEGVLGAVGETVWVSREDLLDPVTAVSGSGPAYVFWFIEHLAAAGARLGLPPADAARLALATVRGAAELAARSDEPPAVLRERVTSKGGTTAAALAALAEEQMAERLARAIEAASRRGAELGTQLDRDA